MVGRRSVCGRRLGQRLIGCTPAICDMNSAAAAAVYCLWCYTSVICFNALCLCQFAFKFAGKGEDKSDIRHIKSDNSDAEHMIFFSLPFTSQRLHEKSQLTVR